MTTEEAVLRLREDPRFGDLVRDAYLGPDLIGNAERFLASPEFVATLRLLGGRVAGAAVLDLGAGTGIASYAFARSGASEVIALEPDPSSVVGQGAIRILAKGLPVTVQAGMGEALPFPDGRFQIVYARQVLHHSRDLDALVRECARVTAPHGVVLAVREHVVNDERQLRAFLDAHPIHRLAGGEHAYSLERYLGAFRRAGLRGPEVLGPLETIVNAYPGFPDEAALHAFPSKALEERFGRLGRVASRVPGVVAMVKRWLEPRDPGRLFSFLGHR